MKNLWGFITILFLCANFLEAQEPHTYSARENNWEVWVQHGSDTPFNYTLENRHAVGETQWQQGIAEFRNINYWTW